MNAGDWIDYLESSGPRIARVLEVLSAKLRVIDVNGRQRTIPARMVISQLNGSPGSDGTGSEGELLVAAIDRLVKEVDSELLWESLPDQGAQVDLDELANLYFGDKHGTQVSATYRAVVNDRHRFKVKNLIVHSRSPLQVADLQLAEERRLAHVTEEEQIQSWLQQATREPVSEIPPQVATLVEEIRQLLLGQEDLLLEARLASLSAGSARFAAFKVLSHCGQLPAGSDPFITMMGLQRGFTQREREAASSIDGPADVTGSTAMGAIAIDDSETREVDDALYAERTPSGLRVQVHIANVAGLLQPDSVLVEAAHRHVATVYLPTGAHAMLPEVFAHGVSSLKEGVARCGLTFDLQFNDRLEIEDWSLKQQMVSLEARLTYDQVDQQLEVRTGSQSWLNDLLDIADALRTRRLEAGAFDIRRREVKFSVFEDTIELKLIPDSKSRLIVSEMMILVNRLAAQYALRNQLPFLFRGQPPPDQPIDWPENYDPARLEPLLKRLKRSQWSSTAAPHAGLGVEEYTQVTSPIRRVMDLVLQMQLAAHLSGSHYPWSEDDLLRTMSAVEATDRLLRQAERKANRFYALRFLEQSPASSHPAIVLPGPPGTPLVETTDTLIRGRLVADGAYHPGQSLRVAVHRIRPADDQLLFRPL